MLAHRKSPLVGEDIILEVLKKWTLAEPMVSSLHNWLLPKQNDLPLPSGIRTQKINNQLTTAQQQRAITLLQDQMEPNDGHLDDSAGQKNNNY